MKKRYSECALVSLRIKKPLLLLLLIRFALYQEVFAYDNISSSTDVNVSTSDLTISNEGIITGNEPTWNAALLSRGTGAVITNSGLINGSLHGIRSSGTIESITNSGQISSDADSAIGIDGLGANVITNTASGTIIGGDTGIWVNASINNINNYGLIQGINIRGITAYSGPIADISNAVGATIIGGVLGIENYHVMQSLTNNGTLSGGLIGLYSGWGGYVNNIVNNGLITSTGSANSTNINASGFAGYSAAAIYNDLATVYGLSVIGSLKNAGTIFAAGSAYGIYNESGATITELTNTGTIYTGTGGFGISNFYDTVSPGIITTLNNAQGSSNAHGPLTYTGVVPLNYNIIINSPTNYGQLVVTNGSGASAFNIYGHTGQTLTAGVPASSVSNNHTYTSVLTGLVGTLSGSTITGTDFSITGATGTYGGYNYTLAANGSGVWDLIFGGLVPTGPTALDTQASLHSLAPKLRGAFSSQTMATNFANMNTYDCNLFDAKGLCVSVGGQQTYVDSLSANMTSAVVVAGYKVSPTFRIGGFLHQNLNSNTGSSVDISNKSPLMGLFAVWNQNENQLGYQVKIANAYQDMDVTTTRDVIGTSEAGRGKTDLNTQSYVGELSYAFLTNEDKTLVRPYAAVRYTRIKQDGYSERTTASVTAPLTYASLADRSTAALVGVKLNHKLTDKVNLTGSLGVEQDLNHDVDNLTASGVSGLTSEAFNNNINRTRPVASIGAYYMPVKNQRIAADIYYQELPFQSTASTTAYVNYMIGF